MKRLAAVVLNYRTVEDTLLAVRALRESRRAVDELIVVDNGSGDGSVDRLGALVPPLTLLAVSANLGFSGGHNVGIREAIRLGADRVLLVNSDALVEPDCVERLEDALGCRADAGIAGPLLLAAADPSSVTSAGIRYSPASGRVRSEAVGARRETLGTALRTVDAVSGAVMLVDREVFERIGFLDEAYFFSFEDVDFCLRARAAGFATICAAGAAARHAGSRTIGRRSPRRLYFAARNHLRLASRVAPTSGRGRALVRAGAILAFNLAYAGVRAEAPRLRGLGAVILGAWDHVRGRYGDRTADRT